MSEDMIKLHIVDLVGGLRSKTFLDNAVLFFGNSHLEVVEDRPEASEVDEPSSSAVLVLEVRLNQQSSVLDIGSESDQAVD